MDFQVPYKTYVWDHGLEVLALYINWVPQNTQGISKLHHHIYIIGIGVPEVPLASKKVLEGVQKITKSSTHLLARPINFELNIAIRASAGQPWMLPEDNKPSMAQCST